MADNLLTTGDFDLLRETAEQSLNDTITIQTKTLVADDRGGATEEYKNAYLNVPARVAEMKGDESVITDQRHLNADYDLTVGFDQTINQSDRIVHETNTYEVIFVNLGRSYNTTRRCLIRRI